jgi:hypothetical protein
MIAMMMGDQDVGELPALALERLQDGTGLRRVDRRRRLGFPIVDQITEIVVSTGESTNFGSHVISIALSPARQIWR